jgi:hypothetical protein
MYGPSILIDLTQQAETQYNFPRCNRLWLPKTLIVSPPNTQANDQGVILGIRINNRNEAMLPWGILDGYVTSVGGDMDKIFVTVLNNPNNADTIALSTGTDVSVGYGNTDGLSPDVGGGEGGSGHQVQRNPGGGGGGQIGSGGNPR